MQKTYYIFRHGETFATKNGTGYGVRMLSAPILPEASPALTRLGAYLKNIPTDFNISSALKRCRQTVEIIGKESEKQFVFDKRLNDYFLESSGHFIKRLKSVLAEIEANDYQSIAICTHGACISTLISLLTAKKDMRVEYNFFKYPPPGVLTIIEGNNVQEVNFNTLVEK
ncbi:MAG: histidine phosphatase family protein [Candidatus Levybacteria bacterium]|nr:histidine phosphatase family protein [Candidatus Levybacteria bacterium]